MPKLTFVVPVYEPDLKVLEKCIKSLLEQSLKEWDAVFVLDGPCPQAVTVIRKAFNKKPNHFKIVEIEHGGACKARNEGFKRTDSPYVIFWDCDCCIEPHAAAAWVEQLDKNPEIGFVYGGYKFFDEKGGIPSEPFDPWTLRVTNYISTCFPVRRELVGPGWNESLESLQDWDFWLGVVERGGKGKFLQGYAFSTAYPTPKSISGKGCTPEAWLGRMDKVRELHNIPKREVCVTSLTDKHDGIALAKLIAADYMDRPNDKPNHYKTIIQIGFSLNPGAAELHASVWGPEHKKALFWTKENIEEAYHGVSLGALDEYAKRINKVCRQFVEDKASQAIMARAGFNVEVMPLPLVNTDPIAPLPEKPRFLVDGSVQYQHALAVIRRALPDVQIDVASGAQKIEDYTGLLHFYVDRTMSPAIKRMQVTGRHIISNVQSPFAGFLDDRVNDETFIVNVVERVRKIIKQGPNLKAVAYYQKALTPEKLKGVLCA